MDYKPIRNKLKTFTFDSVTIEILKLLRLEERDDDLRLPVWHLLLLLKWNYEFVPKKNDAKVAKAEDIDKLMKQVEKLEMSNPLFRFSSVENKNKPFIMLAHQQFTYQNEVFLDTFARQYTLFCDLQSRYDIESSFENLTKIKINTFLQISFVVWCFTFEYKKLNNSNTRFFSKGALSKDDYKDLLVVFKKEDIDNYLKLLSLFPTKIEQVIKSDNRLVKSYNLQPFEQSIFIRKPFLIFQNSLFLPYKKVLNHNFNHFIYEFLKIKDEKFTTEFGIRMEKYVKLGLDEVKIDYLTEKQLEKKLGLKNNLVDFVTDNILIEVKAIEMKPYSGVSPDDKTLAQEFRKSLVKAYAKQMINVANKLKTEKTFYGIIITYKKLFLGNSDDIWEQFLEEETLKIHNKDKLKVLPHKNLFFIDIESWDYLIQLVKNKNYSITEVLDKIKETDSNPKTKKFNFSLHLSQDFQLGKLNLSYILKSYKESMNFEKILNEN